MAKKNTTESDTSVTPDVMAGPPPTTAVAKAAPKGALTIPTMEDVELRVATAAEKLQAFGALLTDPDLPESTRSKVKAILEQANPRKRGMEEVNAVWTVTRLSVVQPTTQATAKPDAAKPGDIYTAAGSLLQRPFNFIPIYFNYENVMFEVGEKAPTCSSPDGKLGSLYGVCAACPNLPFGQQNGGRGEQKKTDCQNQIVVALLAADLSNLYVMAFGKTSRGAGSALMGLAKQHPFPWKQSYMLNTEKKTNDTGTYYVLKIEPTGKENPPDVIKVADVLSDLYEANRHRALGEFYLRAGNAAQTAAAGEAAFNAQTSSKLDDGLGDEPDLSTPPPSTARSASKPM